MPAFRRQHPIGPYVLDFYSAKARLAIDPRTAIRGDRTSHEVEDQRSETPGLGVTVTRIAAIDVLRAADAVADGLMRLAAAMIEAEDPLHHASRGPPPPLRRGG